MGAPGNRQLVIFLLKLFGLIVGWLLIYHYLFLPTRLPDKWLTDAIAAGSSVLLNIFSASHYTWADDPAWLAAHIYKGSKTVLVIVDGCNGLDFMAIYLGLVILFPYALRRKIIFSIVGLVTLILANILRCVILYWIGSYHRDLFVISHHYVFTLLMYLVVLALWILYTRVNKNKDEVKAG